MEHELLRQMLLCLFPLPLKTAQLITVETNHSSHYEVGAREARPFGQQVRVGVYRGKCDRSVERRDAILDETWKGAECVLSFRGSLCSSSPDTPFISPSVSQSFTALSLACAFKSLPTEGRRSETHSHYGVNG